MKKKKLFVCCVCKQHHKRNNVIEVEVRDTLRGNGEAKLICTPCYKGLDVSDSALRGLNFGNAKVSIKK